ncbi:MULTISPECIES: DUF3102 domain-containing protein [unclassified Xanthobacter]|uniref:DUF3102 domain-containing protein n=1 Tax=unclassified Xanthobacter TaxID=2623496 RepID=UPI001F2B2A64
MNAVVIVEDPAYLAREINYNHQQVVEHGKSMLAYAVEAGKHLIAVKGMLQHGKFGKWVKENCVFSERMARRYMQVAKTDTRDRFDLDTSLRKFLGIEDAKTPHPTPTDLSQDDASHALKLHALVERGATEGERDVARRKLEAFAKGFGRTAEALVEKAQDILPDWQKTDKQVRVEKAEAEAQAAKAEAAALRAQLEAIKGRINQLRTDCMGMTREALEEAYIGLVLEREGLTKINEKAAR